MNDKETHTLENRPDNKKIEQKKPCKREKELQNPIIETKIEAAFKKYQAKQKPSNQ